MTQASLLADIAERLHACSFVAQQFSDADVLLLVSDGCPACVRFKKQGMNTLRRTLASQNLTTKVIDLDQQPKGRMALASIGQQTIPAMLSRVSIDKQLDASKTWKGIYHGSPNNVRL